MFCNKCGARIADTAVFCNKCGASIQPPKQKIQSVSSQSTYQMKEIPKIKIPKIKIPWVGILIALVIVVGICMILFKKPSIYGTWTDANNAVSFTFQKDGSLRISGKKNILGADLFQFTDDKDGNITLQAQGGLGGVLSIDMQYKLSKDTLILDILGQKITLHRADGNNVVQDMMENPEEAGNIAKDAVEDALDVFQSISLYGTWTDSSGYISMTFNKNGTIRIGGLSDALGAELFTFTEVDNDTLQLKADTDNSLLKLVSINLNYEISGDVMTVEVAGQTYQLKKQN